MALTEDAPSLSLRLDALLERYLVLVDRYDALRHQTARHFSSGFLSLAQANFQAPGRIRYGQDLYDGRMQATLVVVEEEEEEEEEEGERSPLRVLRARAAMTTSVRAGRGETETETEREREGEVGPGSYGPTAEQQLPVPKGDAMRQFGILVPPALRAARDSFRSGTAEGVVGLANVEREMRAVETEVRRTRKMLRRTGAEDS